MRASPPFTPTRRRLLGFGVVALAAGYVGWRQLTAAPFYSGTSLSVDEAHRRALAGEVLLIDIRRPDEWQRTGLPEGGYPLDMRREDFIAELQKLAGNDPSRPIALICARGVRSARMSLRLTEAGFTTIIDVPEGMLGSAAGPGWLGRGLPVKAQVKS